MTTSTGAPGSIPFPTGPGAGPPGEAVLASVCATVAEVLETPVRPEDSYVDLGGDSLRAIEVVARLEEALGTELSIEALYDSPSFAALAEAIVSGAPVTG